MPRFEAENMAANLALVKLVEEMAAEKGITAAQLALAWVLAKGDFIVPIPGARKIPNLEQNAAAADVTLSDADVKRLDDMLSPDKISGARYGGQAAWTPRR
jgi:aryl-alcohol dehydrogenase-like predicted oxidoreductase